VARMASWTSIPCPASDVRMIRRSLRPEASCDSCCASVIHDQISGPLSPSMSSNSVRQVLRRVVVDNPGEYNYIAGKQVERSEILDTNAPVLRRQDHHRRIVYWP
jgi:hypothetical protein